MLHATSLFLQPSENIRKSGGIVGDKLHDMGLPFNLLTVYLLYSAYLPVGDILENVFNFVTTTH